MASKKISQREALRNKRELKKLRQQLDEVQCMYPGTSILTLKVSDALYHSVVTARALGYVVIANHERNSQNEQIVRFRAIKLT